MPTQRQHRVNQLLQQEISGIILAEIQDPQIGFVTVTGVEVSPDLGHAQVYVSVLGDENKTQETMAALRGGAYRFIRGRLAERVALKHIPELHFELDETARHAQQIEMLLHQVDEEWTDEDEPRNDQ